MTWKLVNIFMVKHQSHFIDMKIFSFTHTKKYFHTRTHMSMSIQIANAKSIRCLTRNPYGQIANAKSIRWASKNFEIPILKFFEIPILFLVAGYL